MADGRPIRSGLNEITGAVADLGVLIPLASALIIVNGVDPTAVFLAAGLLVVSAGAFFRIPFPVQPLKALTAVAVARELSPDVIHAAGLEIAAFLALLSIGGIAELVARAFTKPVVRALQFGVGILLVISALKLVARPPEMFRATPDQPWPFVLAVAAGISIAFAARRRHYAIALVILVGGTLAAWLVSPIGIGRPSLTLPAFDVPDGNALATAFVLLVVPQLPLTFGNAVVAVRDVAHEYFGPRAVRVTPSRVCLSAAAGNTLAALIGGMPMCHGSGGLTAHVRLGARTAVMNAILGIGLVVPALFYAAQLTIILGLLPVWVLAAFLAYSGLRHAGFAADLRGRELVAAVAAGGLGAATRNLAITLGVSLVAAHLLQRRVGSAQDAQDVAVVVRPAPEAELRNQRHTSIDWKG